jgi:SAM-dependent methyltransferase
MSNLTNKTEKKYWNDFYLANEAPDSESSFSQYCRAFLPHRCIIIDVGCGNFRDSRFFAALGLRVIAIDTADVGHLAPQYPGLTFVRSDAVEFFAELDAWLQKADAANLPVVLYGRFFLHSLSDGKRRAFLDAVRDAKGIRLACFEFRTKQDADLPKHFGEHSRWFVDLDETERVMTAGGRFTVMDKIQGRGLSPFLDEDPELGRLILREG